MQPAIALDNLNVFQQGGIITLIALHCSGLLYPCTLPMKFMAVGFYRLGQPDMATLTVTRMIRLMAPSHNIPSFA